MANVTICECDVDGCKATARVQHQYQVPEGWVRRAVVDTIAAEHFGESDYSGNQQWLFCPVHVALMQPPLAVEVVAQLEQRKQRAISRSAARAEGETDEGSESSAD